MSDLNHENATTRRTLLKAGAVSAAAGATAPWIERSASSASASTTINSEKRARRVAAMNEGGLSEDRLERMDQILAGVVERGDVPGLVALVSRRGQTHVTAVGTKAFDGNAPMERDTIFRIMSITKPITATAAMMLVEDGVLHLDDPVDPLLPELANRRVLKRIDGPLDETEPAVRPLTLRDLLTFRLGYGAIFTSSPLQEAMTKAGVAPGPILPELPTDELMAAYGSLPLAHQPGTQWLYNSGSEILGVLIARATGQSLGEVFQERIFTPLGMKDTAFSVPSDKLDRFPAAYWTNFQTGKREQIDGIKDSRWSRPPVFENGAGGLVSTADDLLAFGEMMLKMGKYGEQRLLSRPSIEVMTTDQLTPAQKAASVFFPGLLG